jgi:WXG100 family type VII secretion target
VAVGYFRCTSIYVLDLGPDIDGGSLLSQVNAVTSELLAAASDADQTAENITASLARLINQLDDLPGGFQGGAATAFENAKLVMQSKLNGITDALHSVANGVRNSGNQFEYADQEAKDEVSRIVADLGGL